MKTKTILAYLSTVSLTLSIAFTAHMTWISAFLFSMGLMIVLNNIMRDR